MAQRKKTFLVVCLSILTVAVSAQSKDSVPVDKKLLPPFHISLIDSSYYARQLGFFCKKELQVQRLVRLPIYFRLGSLEYCNKLEGK
jgi:hypothetical protein